MSRSNPTENSLPNPAQRWFEWNGELGVVRYYDKDAKQNVVIGDDFTFLLLDQLGSVRGWHDASDSGIYSNEVKDTRQDALIVKSFKGGTLAEGIYKAIKDKVGAHGGQFVTNCYIAFKNGDSSLALGSLRLKGAALNAWVEFQKAHRADIYKKAIRIKGVVEGKKGRIVYRVPVFHVADISDETNTAAMAIDAELQAFLLVYLKKTKRDQAEVVARHVSDEEIGSDGASTGQPLTDDDIPF